MNQNDDTYITAADKMAVILIFGFQRRSAAVARVKKKVSLCVSCVQCSQYLYQDIHALIFWFDQICRYLQLKEKLDMVD